MNTLRTSFLAAALAALAAPGASAFLSDADFSVTVQKINEAAAKVAAAQAKRSQAQKTAEKKPQMCTPAQIDAAYTDLARCEASIQKTYGTSVRDYKGVLIKGFNRREFSLVLLTTTDAFFYHEDCDICEAVERCSLKDGSLSNFKTAHVVNCDDLAPFLKKDVAYTACPLP